MTDPLRVLTTEDLPVQPDPSFTARLRARLEAVASLSEPKKGLVMSASTTTEPPRPAALPYLTVADARAAIDWYRDAFSAELIGEPIVMDDGRIGHAELAVGGGVLYLADEFADLGLQAPAPGVNSVSLMLHVADTDAVLTRARAHGGDVQREPYEGHGARNATIRDPFGHRWMLSGPVREPIRHGDIGYVSLRSPDTARAVAFYSHVLGWVCDATGRVTNTVEAIDVSRDDRTTLFCCYAVDDLDEARAAIGAAGGRTGGRRETAVGTVVDAVDADGTAFAVYVPTSGQPRPLLNGAGPGELSYVTHEVGDAAAFREFYGRVLGWTFEPGRVEDGWAVQTTQPMSGAAGGSHAPAIVPMWTVSDIDAAVTRVREAGGTVLAEPSRQPYGLMAECTDDQGGRFYLGEF
jgi:predicted enzyme related to lactoylglutathione lyase